VGIKSINLEYSMQMILSVFGIVLFQLVGCTTSPKVNVIERADSLSDKPDWASTINSSFEREGRQYFVGYVEVEGQASKSAALNMSDEKAMAEPLRSLSDQFLDQNQVGEELRKGDSIGQRVISVTRGYRPPMAGLKIVNRYWELVRVPNQDDLNLTRVELRAYSLAELPKSDYEQAKRDYFTRLKGDPEVKAILKEVGEKQRSAAMK